MSMWVADGKDHQDEKQLIKALRAGNRLAFRELYMRHHPRLTYYALKLAKSAYVAEEIIQEVFVKLWVHRESIDPQRPLEPYIYRMTRNHLFNYLKKAAHQKELKAALSSHMQLARNQTDEAIRDSELNKLLEQALQKLTAKKRAIYEMSRNEGKSLDEIAEQMNLSKKTVKNHLWEALVLIKKELQLTTDIAFPALILVLFG